MGRAAVDLYGEQIGGRLEDMRPSPSTSAARPPTPRSASRGSACKPAMLTRVGDEHNGRFVRETLAAEGVDVRHVTTDPKRLTALVFLGIRDRETFPLVFYRDNCADMALAAERRRRRLHRLGAARCCSPARTCRSRGTLDACRAGDRAGARRAARASSSTSTTGRCCGA